MDSKEYLIRQIKTCRRKMNMAKLIDSGTLFAAAGGVFGALCELASLVWRFYYVHLAAGLCFGAGLLAGMGYTLYKRADMRQAAGRLDSFGLKERMITAYEQMGNDHEFALMQRQDAVDHYNRIRERIKISLWPDKRHVLALALSVSVAVGLGFLPSPVREQARIRHQVREQAKEELEGLEELADALEGVDMDSLTQEQRAQLQEMADAMELSREELAKADTWESLASATERLDYKYGQTAKGLESLAGQLDNPDAAGVAGAEALAKAMANQGGSQLASSGTPSAGSEGEGGDGSDSGVDGEGQDGADGSGSGDGQDGGNGQSQGNGSGQGQGSGSGQGQGNGSGQGQGQGQGSGSGQGQGNGNGGSGSGNGRGTGSSDAVHDYVSIPNAVANDPSLTGNKTGDKDSDYYRQQNGLAWEGDHVDYNSVIGEYTDSAYEGIANGKYPSGMETVIRDYFENLNK